MTIVMEFLLIPAIFVLGFALALLVTKILPKKDKAIWKERALHTKHFDRVDKT